MKTKREEEVDFVIVKNSSVQNIPRLRDEEMSAEKSGSTVYEIICTIYKLCRWIWGMFGFILQHHPSSHDLQPLWTQENNKVRTNETQT